MQVGNNSPHTLPGTPPLPQLMSVCTDRQDRTQVLLKRRRWEANPGPLYTGDLLSLHNGPVQGELRFTTHDFQLQLPSPAGWAFSPSYPTARPRHGHFFGPEQNSFVAELGVNTIGIPASRRVAQHLNCRITLQVLRDLPKTHLCLFRKKIHWQNTTVVYHKGNTVFANSKPGHTNAL